MKFSGIWRRAHLCSFTSKEQLDSSWSYICQEQSYPSPVCMLITLVRDEGTTISSPRRAQFSDFATCIPRSLICRVSFSSCRCEAARPHFTYPSGWRGQRGFINRQSDRGSQFFKFQSGNGLSAIASYELTTPHACLETLASTSCDKIRLHHAVCTPPALHTVTDRDCNAPAA